MTTGRSVLDVIMENKNRIKYITERYDDTGSDFLFRFYFDKKNIFGFRKYLNIIMYNNPENYNPEKDAPIVDVYIPINIFRKDCLRLGGTSAKVIAKELQCIYNKYYYDETCKLMKKLGLVLHKNLEE